MELDKVCKNFHLHSVHRNGTLFIAKKGWDLKGEEASARFSRKRLKVTITSVGNTTSSVEEDYN